MQDAKLSLPTGLAPIKIVDGQVKVPEGVLHSSWKTFEQFVSIDMNHVSMSIGVPHGCMFLTPAPDSFHNKNNIWVVISDTELDDSGNPENRFVGAYQVWFDEKEFVDLEGKVWKNVSTVES
ncbi:hypothetical protein VPHD479_0234 [Vibrio phage D479]